MATSADRLEVVLHIDPKLDKAEIKRTLRTHFAEALEELAEELRTEAV